MDAQRRHIYERLQNGLYPKEGGAVYLSDIVKYMQDFGLNPQDLGKYIRDVFEVDVSKAKSHTVYKGISWRPLTLPQYGPASPYIPSTHTLPQYGPASPYGPSTHTLPQYGPASPYGPSTHTLPQYGPASPYRPLDLLQVNAQLQAQIKKLEEEKASLKNQLQEVGTLNEISIWKHVDNVFTRELKSISSANSILSRKIRSLEDIRNLNIKDIRQSLTSQAPQFYRLISTLITTSFKEDDSYSTVMLISAITHARSQRSSVLQIVISLYLLLTASQHQIIKLLNHTHQCVSFATATKALESFADSAKAEQKKKSPGTVEVWTYDNLNIMKRIRHVRRERHAEMHNWTTRLVVPVRNPPPEDLGEEPQGRRQDLTEFDILQNEEDTEALKERFVKRIVQLLVEKFRPFQKFGEEVVTESRHHVKRSTYTPLEVLDLDESKTSDNIRILLQFAEDRGGGLPQDQVVLGDQATCKNIRGAKRLRQTETDPLQSLKWANETPGDFHFCMEAGRTVLLAFWSSPRNVGSVGHLRDLVDRRTVDSLGKNFNAMDELLHHMEEAHLTAALLTHLQLQTTGDEFHVDNLEQVKDLASEFVDTLATQPFSQEVDDALYQLGHRLLYHLLLYTDLRQTIRNEDGEGIVQHWKYWLPLFLGKSRGNYSTEALNFLAQLQTEWSPRTAFIATHNRTVNLRGKAGCGKAMDMLVEHYNRLLKSILRGSGGKLTIEHAKRVSLGIPLLDEARRFCVKTFGISRTTSHTTRSAATDIQEMVDAIQGEQVYTPREGCRISLGNKYSDPIEKAFIRINDDKWIASTLLKHSKKHVPEMYDVEIDTDVLMDE